MTSFTARSILTSQTIGERLAKIRQGSGLSLSDVSRQLGIKRQYLEAIEIGHYADLPGDIYALEFVKSYARCLRLDGEQAGLEYGRERESEKQRQTPVRRLAFSFKPLGKNMWSARPLLSRLILILPLAALVFYGGRMAVHSFLPPQLEVFSPASYYEVTGSLVALSGQAAPGSRVFVNNEELRLNASGAFSETINVAPGQTIFKITAEDSQGRTRTVYRVVRSGRGQVAGANVNRFYKTDN